MFSKAISRCANDGTFFQELFYKLGGAKPFWHSHPKVEGGVGRINLQACLFEGFSSAQFVEKLLEECAIVCTPGNGFGEHGEGYFRISLTVPTQRLLEAAERIKGLRL